MKKVTFIIISIFLFILLLSFFYIYYKNDNKVAILAYHGVLPKKLNTSKDNLIVDAEKFEEELKLLKKLGYHTMTLEEFNCWKKGKCPKKHKSVFITFDDGYKNNYEYAYALLKKYNMNAVVFVVGSYVEANDSLHMNIDELNQVFKKYPNIEVASHSYNLHYHSNKTYEEVDADIKKMSKLPILNYYAYPFGDYNDNYIKALQDNHYELAFTFGPKKEHRKADIKDNNYKIPRLNISNDMSHFKFLARLLLPL